MTTLSRVGEIARRADPDRFFTSLFAPQSRREALWTLYAFNNELVRARESVREPMMALIRLQWWREVVEGAARRHDVADPVRAALDAGTLHAADLLHLIEAREADPPECPASWVTFVQDTAGAVAVAAGHALGAMAVEGIRAAGAAYGAAGVTRNRTLAGLPPMAELQQAGQGWLAEMRRNRIPRAALAAALPAVFAARDLTRTQPARERLLADKLAVWLAAKTGRL